MNITLQESQVDSVTVRLIERACCDFVILYLAADIAAIWHRTTNRADANEWFITAVQIAQMGFTHPAWRQPTKQIHINIGE
jgi:hypothetical protein